MAKPKKMNRAQFKAICESKYINIMPKRTKAVEAVIFDGLTGRSAEDKFNIERGTISRDVIRVNDFYEFCLMVGKERPAKK